MNDQKKINEQSGIEVIIQEKPEMAKDKTFCLLPIEVAKDRSLKASEKIIFSEILVHHHYNGEFFGTNQYLSELVSLSPSRVSQILTDLNRRGYIKITLYRSKESIKVWKRVIQPNLYWDAEIFKKERNRSLRRKRLKSLFK